MLFSSVTGFISANMKFSVYKCASVACEKCAPSLTLPDNARFSRSNSKVDDRTGRLGGPFRADRAIQ